MAWSKLKQNLENFLHPALQGRVEYRSTSYRYVPDKAGHCYIAVDKKNILNMTDPTTLIKWYESELEIKNDPDIQLPISQDEIEAVRSANKGAVPEERLKVMARSRKMSQYAKGLLSAQSVLSKSDFVVVANQFLTSSIEESLETDHILLNIFALVDRRVGKKRLVQMAGNMKLKHPCVQFFYELRLGSL